jgi:DNA-binding winged helix-turn-helix (wHTH) protein
LKERGRFHEVVVKTHFGPFEFDVSNQLLWRGGDAVPLPPRVVGVLGLLVARPGEVVSRQELIETVWKDAFVSDTSLAEAVSFLRQALGDDPQQPSYIQTVHRRGYRFLPAAVPAAPAPVAPLTEAETGSRGEVRDAWAQIVPWSIAILLGVMTASALWRLSHPDLPILQPVARFDVALPAATTLDASGPAIALSPTGARLAFTACGVDGCRIVLRALDQVAANAIGGTEGGAAPFFSPDEDSLGFFADGKLKSVSLAGGAATTLADARHAFGGAWLTDGTIVFASSLAGGLQRVGSGGGPLRAAIEVDARAGELRYESPEAVPGSRAVLATAVLAPSMPSLARVVAISLDTGQRTVVVDRASAPRFIAPNVLTFVRDGDLMAAAFDASQLKVVGQPVVVVPRVGEHPSQYAVSRLGALALAGPAQVPAASLAWAGPDGALTPTADAVQAMAGADLSADGRRIVAAKPDGDRADLWWADVDRGTLSRLTFEGQQRDPRWGADRRLVVFTSRVRNVFNLFARSVDDNAAPRRLTDSAHQQTAGAISRDGHVLYTDFDPASGADIWSVALAGGTAPAPVVRTPFDESDPALSPDGRWLAYQGNESNRWEVYLRPYPAGGAAVPISAGGGRAPAWSRDGRTLYYAGRDGVMAVALAADVPSKPLAIVRGPWIPRGTSPDGRLLVERDRTQLSGVDRIGVTLQWSRELQRLIPSAVVSSPK